MVSSAGLQETTKGCKTFCRIHQALNVLQQQVVAHLRSIEPFLTTRGKNSHTESLGVSTAQQVSKRINSSKLQKAVIAYDRAVYDARIFKNRSLFGEASDDSRKINRIVKPCYAARTTSTSGNDKPGRISLGGLSISCWRLVHTTIQASKVTEQSLPTGEAYVKQSQLSTNQHVCCIYR